MYIERNLFTNPTILQFYINFSDRPFAHSPFDSKIKFVHVFYRRVKWFPFHGRAPERTMNLSIIFLNL